MGELDIAAKALLEVEPRAFIQLVLPGHEITKVEQSMTEVQMVDRRMDKVMRVELTGQRRPIWVHFEVQAAWAANVPKRVFDYWSLAHRKRSALRSVVLVLRPGKKQGEPTNVHQVSVLGATVLTFGFDLICAWDLQGDKLVEGRVRGLLPLVPFTKGATPELVEKAAHILAGEPRSGDLQTLLAIFSTRASRTSTGSPR